jgi:hypothetical protein
MFLFVSLTNNFVASTAVVNATSGIFAMKLGTELQHLYCGSLLGSHSVLQHGVAQILLRLLSSAANCDFVTKNEQCSFKTTLWLAAQFILGLSLSTLRS